MVFDLGKTIQCVCSAEDSSGDEVMFFGDDSGWVYQLDKGTSLDGSELSAFVRLPFNHVGSPTHDKRWHKATIEVDAKTAAQLSLTAEYAYGSPDIPPPVEVTFDAVRGGGGFGTTRCGRISCGTPQPKGWPKRHSTALPRTSQSRSSRPLLMRTRTSCMG